MFAKAKIFDAGSQGVEDSVSPKGEKKIDRYLKWHDDMFSIKKNFKTDRTVLLLSVNGT